MTRRSPLTPLPPDFGVTPELRVWAEKRGYTQLDERMEHFRDYCLAKPAMYADYAAAFRNAVRLDWAHLNGKSVNDNNHSLPWLDPRPGESTEAWMARRHGARH